MISPAGIRLFDPVRHEPPAGGPWDEQAARAGIAAIVDDTLRSVGPDGLWPAHPRDEPATPDTRYAMLYLGAGGIVWALRQLSRLGFCAGSERLEATATGLVQRNREVGETHLGGTASLLMGDAGLLLLAWQVTGDRSLADRLFGTVEGNLHHPAREGLWGSPGTLIAAIHMAEATGEGRWADLLERGVRILWDEMELDPSTALWVWRQDLYGRMRCFIGAGHGFAGNVYPVLRGASLLPPALVAAFVDRAWQTLHELARHDPAMGINWWPDLSEASGSSTKPPLVQDCHGAPGIVCRLAGVPRSPPWDDLLAAAGEFTWAAGPLAKGPGLCHGTAGNGYALLKLHVRTGEAFWLERARAFAMHALKQVQSERDMHGQGRHSLWTGDLGVALYLRSCIDADAAFPTLDVF